MQSAGLGLCRNRYGNQFHTRIHIPKDLAPLLGRAEMRLSLGTEVRRYAVQAARLLHAGKITVSDEIRAVMKESDANPTVKQQAEMRKQLLAAIRKQKNEAPRSDEVDDTDTAQYAQEADEEHERRRLQEAASSLLQEDVEALLMVAHDQMKEVSQQRAMVDVAEVARQAAIGFRNASK